MGKVFAGRVNNTTNKDKHLNLKEECQNIKEALDLIADQIPILGNQSSILGRSEIEFKKLDVKKQRNFSQAVLDLIKYDLVDYSGETQSFIATSRPSREMLAGKNIKVIDVNAFENYRSEVLKLCDFIYQDGVKRFPDAYEQYTEKYSKKVISKKENGVLQYGDIIKKIEVLENSGRVKIYVNGDYLKCLDFSRKKNWGKMYELAENGLTDYDKGFLDYFNSNLKNPLYCKHGFGKTQILKVEDENIVKNIEKIELVTQKKITQRLKTA